MLVVPNKTTGGGHLFQKFFFDIRGPVPATKEGATFFKNFFLILRMAFFLKTGGPPSRFCLAAYEMVRKGLRLGSS